MVIFSVLVIFTSFYFTSGNIPKQTSTFSYPGSIPDGWKFHDSCVLREETFKTNISPKPKIKCNIRCHSEEKCKFSMISGSEEDDEQTCTLFSDPILTKGTMADPTAKIWIQLEEGKSKSDYEKLEFEILLLHQDSRNNDYFTSGEMGRNKDQPNEKLFSILDEMYDNGEQFRSSDGKFYFKICYPELSEECYLFAQTSNPMTTNTVSDFEYFSGPFPLHNSMPLTGLRRDNPAKSMLNGVNTMNWWYAMGSYSLEGTGIPGRTGVYVKLVDFYVIMK